MSFERSWPTVPPQAFTGNGTAWGLVTVADVAGFRVKQVAALTSISNPVPLAVQVKIVLSPTTLIVGYVDNQIANWKKLDISAYTVVSGASITAGWQDKNKIGKDDITKATYEADPVVAERVINVDQYGDFYTAENALAVSPVGQFFSSLTLGALGIPDMIAELSDGWIYDEVVSNTVGNVETLTFKESGSSVGTILITYGPNGWTDIVVG